MNKSLLAALSLMCCFGAHASLWTDEGNYDISWYNSANHSFTLSTPRQLAGLAYLVNSRTTNFIGDKIYLESDIDLSGHEWVPIDGFKGDLDGNGTSIKGVRITDSSSGDLDVCGFFKSASRNIIRDIKVSGSISLTNSKAHVVGGFIGSSDHTVFNKCSSQFDITVNYSFDDDNLDTHFNIGGFAGYSNTSDYYFCEESGNVRVTISDDTTEATDATLRTVYAGGFIGNSDVDEYYFNGKCCGSVEIDMQSADPKRAAVYLAGFAGYANICGHIQSCFSNADAINLKTVSENCSIYVSGIVAYYNFSRNKKDGDENDCYTSTTNFRVGPAYNKTGSYFGAVVATYMKRHNGYNYYASDMNLEVEGGGEYEGNVRTLGTTFTSESMRTEDLLLNELNTYIDRTTDAFKAHSDVTWVKNPDDYPRFNRNIFGGIGDIRGDEAADFMVVGSRVLFEDPVDFEIYSLQGGVVFSGNASVSPRLDPGVYILCVNGKTAKFIIR